jgi:hypothetical protein
MPELLARCRSDPDDDQQTVLVRQRMKDIRCVGCAS